MVNIEVLNKSLKGFFNLETRHEKALLKSYFELVQEFKEWLGVSPNLPEFREQWNKSLESLNKEKDSRFNFTTILRVIYFRENGGKIDKFHNISNLVESLAILKHSGVKTGPDALVFSGPPDSIQTIEQEAGKSVKAIRESRKEGKPDASKGKPEAKPEAVEVEADKAEAKPEAPPVKNPETIARMIVSYLDDADILVAFCIESKRLNRTDKIISRLTEIGKITGSKLPVVS